MIKNGVLVIGIIIVIFGNGNLAAFRNIRQQKILNRNSYLRAYERPGKQRNQDFSSSLINGKFNYENEKIANYSLAQLAEQLSLDNNECKVVPNLDHSGYRDYQILANGLQFSTENYNCGKSFEIYKLLELVQKQRISGEEKQGQQNRNDKSETLKSNLLTSNLPKKDSGKKSLKTTTNAGDAGNRLNSASIYGPKGLPHGNDKCSPPTTCPPQTTTTCETMTTICAPSTTKCDQIKFTVLPSSLQSSKQSSKLIPHGGLAPNGIPPPGGTLSPFLKTSRTKHATICTTETNCTTHPKSISCESKRTEVASSCIPAKAFTQGKSTVKSKRSTFRAIKFLKALGHRKYPSEREMIERKNRIFDRKRIEKIQKQQIQNRKLLTNSAGKYVNQYLKSKNYKELKPVDRSPAERFNSRVKSNFYPITANFNNNENAFQLPELKSQKQIYSSETDYGNSFQNNFQHRQLDPINIQSLKVKNFQRANVEQIEESNQHSREQSINDYFANRAINENDFSYNRPSIVVNENTELKLGRNDFNQRYNSVEGRPKQSFYEYEIEDSLRGQERVPSYQMNVNEY